MEHSRELKANLNDLHEKTGIAVFLEPQGGEETPFFVEWDGRAVEAYLPGVGREAEKLAKFVAYHVATCSRESFLGKHEELRSVLLGAGGSWRALRYMTKYNLTDGACFALEVICDRLEDEIIAHLERCVSEGRDAVVPMEEGRIAVVKFLDGESSPKVFGAFLAQSLYEELGVKASVGVGCEMKSFGDISSSYAQAVAAVRMGAVFHTEGEVHSYREYLLVRMLEDAPKSRLKEYMELFHTEGAAEIFGDTDMLQTAEAFLENNLNVSETSRALFMHRNTLSYRLDKIERATGLNVRKFQDAVTFRVLTILYKLLEA